MRVYDLKKREKALLFLVQKMAQLGLVAYFATKPVSCPLILKGPQKSECFQHSEEI